MKKILTEKAPPVVGPYSQGIIVNDLIFTSGQIGTDPKTGLLVDGFEAQAELCCLNVKAILEEAGSGMDKVIKATCFLTDMNNFTTFNAIYEKHFISVPARSCVAVKELPKGAICEIEAIAMK